MDWVALLQPLLIPFCRIKGWKGSPMHFDYHSFMKEKLAFVLAFVYMCFEVLDVDFPSLCLSL